MKKDANIELFRCICMLGIVCIHVFSGASEVSHHAWALSCPCLLGFMMISGWFGIHFRLTKLLRLFGVVVACVLTDTVILGGGRGQSVSDTGMCGRMFLRCYSLL